MKKIFLSIGFLILVFFGGCKKDNISVSFDYEKFLEMKGKWETLNILNYSYTFSFNGFSCFSNNIEIKNNLINRIVPDTSQCFFIDTTNSSTISQIFSNIDYIYNNPCIKKINRKTYYYCKEIKIEYDPIYYFPIYYEFIYEGKNMDLTDTENSQHLTNFLEQ